MTTTPPILRNSALTAPVAVALAWAIWGPEHALAAALTSALLLGNLWSLSILGPRIVQGVAAPGGDPWLGLWAGAIAAKFLLVAGAFVALAKLLPPVGMAMGFLPMLIGPFVTALQLARADTAPGSAPGPDPLLPGPRPGDARFGDT